MLVVYVFHFLSLAFKVQALIILQQLQRLLLLQQRERHLRLLRLARYYLLHLLAGLVVRDGDLFGLLHPLDFGHDDVLGREGQDGGVIVHGTGVAVHHWVRGGALIDHWAVVLLDF